MLLNNVTLTWVKLDKTNPDMGFDKNSPQYSLVATTGIKADADTWKAAGINVKPKEENGAIVYSVTLKKKIYTDADGKYNTPAPVVVDKQLQPITDTKTIGNGSTGNVQVKFKPYEYMGKKGISVQLLAVQVLNIVEYAGGDKLEFAAIDTDKEII